MASFKTLLPLLALAFVACGGRDLDNRGTISLDDDPALGRDSRRAIAPYTGEGGTDNAAAGTGGVSAGGPAMGGTGPGGAAPSAGSAGASAGFGGQNGGSGGFGGFTGGAGGTGGTGPAGGVGGLGGDAGAAGASGAASEDPVWLMIDEGSVGTLVNAREPSQSFANLGLGQYDVWSPTGSWMYQTVDENVVFYDLSEYPLGSFSYTLPNMLADRPVWIGDGIFLPGQGSAVAAPAFMHVNGSSAGISVMSNATSPLLGFASADGSRLGFSAYNGAAYDLYSTQFVSGTPTSTTHLITVPGGSPALYPSWSSDARWALFSADGTYLWNSGLSSPPLRINADGSPLRSFSPDGSLLLTHVGSATNMLNVHDLRGATPGPEQPVHPGALVDLSPGEWSPDGSFVTYHGGSDGFVTPIAPDGAAGNPVTLEGATYECGIQWAAADTLVYASCSNATPVVNVVDVAEDGAIQSTETLEWFGEGALVSPDGACIARWGQGAIRISNLRTNSSTQVDMDLVEKVEWARDSSGVAFLMVDETDAFVAFIDVDACATDGGYTVLEVGLQTTASFTVLPRPPAP